MRCSFLRLRIRARAALVAGLLGVPLPAAATSVLFSNLGPGDSFNASSGLSVGSVLGPNQEVAVPLTLVQDASLDSVEVGVRHIFGSATIDVRIAQGAAGAPGTILGAIGITAPDSPALVTANFGGAISLEAFVPYWIWLSAPSGANDIWHYNTTTSFGVYVTSTDAGTTWGRGGGAPPAYRVNGTPIPEPAALVLLGGGLAAIGATRQLGRSRRASCRAPTGRSLLRD